MKVMVSCWNNRKCAKCGHKIKVLDHVIAVWLHGERLQHYPDCNNPKHGAIGTSVYEVSPQVID